VGAAELEHLPPLLGAEAGEVLLAVDDDADLARRGERIQCLCLRDAKAALRGECAALDPRRLSADEGQERRAALDPRQLILEPSVELQDSVISR
jgi:hypothetical protein